MKLLKPIMLLGASVAVCAAGTSCSHSTTATAGTPIEFTLYADSVGYLSCDPHPSIDSYYDTIYAAVRYSVVWPSQADNEELNVLRDSLLNLTFRGIDATTFDDAIKQLTSDIPLENLKDEFNAEPFLYSQIPFTKAFNSYPSYEALVNSEVAWQTPKLLVIQVDKYVSYIGAAHGYGTIRYLNYDIVNHCVLTPENVFKPGNEKAIADLIEAKARAIYGEQQLFDDRITTFKDIRITKDGIEFLYQPYEVGPYSTGTVEVPINRFDLKRFLTPQAADLFDFTH